MFQILSPKSWDAVDQLARSLGSTDWIFRGQGDARWDLQTTLERYAERWHWYNRRRAGLLEAEKTFLFEFQGRAHHYLQTPPTPNDRLEWLALLQHFGGPTRLLDFTSSLYVAAFFAIESFREQTDSAIWAVNLESVQDANQPQDAPRLQQPPVREDLVEMWQRHARVVEGFLAGEFPSTRLGVIDVRPARLNERISVQQGCFLFPFDPVQPFMRNLGETLQIKWQEKPTETAAVGLVASSHTELVQEASLLKVVLPNTERGTALRHLKSMNISAASLFPDLGGFARSFHHRWPEKQKP